MLIFLSHSTTTEYTRQLVRKRAQEWNVECHIYEGGLLNPDFLASLEKTKRERGNERKVTTTIDDDDIAADDHHDGAEQQQQQQQQRQQRQQRQQQQQEEIDYDDDHCKEFIKGVIYGCKRPLTKDIIDDATDDDDDDDDNATTTTATTNDGGQQRRLPPRSRRLRRHRPGALNKWAKYLRLADKGYIKHAGFIASDPDFVNDQEAGKKERSPPPEKSLLGGVSTRASTRKKREEEDATTEKKKKKKKKGEEEEAEEQEVEVEKGQPGRGEEKEKEKEVDMRLEKKAEESREEEEEVVAPEGREEEERGVDIKEQAATTASVEEKKKRQRQDDDGKITVDDVAERRISQSIKQEKTKSNSVIFPAGAILLVDDFEVIDERDSLVTSMLISRNRRRQRGVGGDARGAGNTVPQRSGGGDDGTAGGEQNKFRQHTLQTYRILSQLFSSVSNHFHLHVIAIAHSQNLSGSTSGQLSHLARLVKNSISTYTVFLSLASREKKNLLLNHVSGADYAAIRQLMQVASREGNNDQEADEQNVQQHPAITFEFNPRTMNFREENTAPTDDRDNAVTVPFSFLDHAYLTAVQAGQNSHPLFSRLERRENRI